MRRYRLGGCLCRAAVESIGMCRRGRAVPLPGQARRLHRLLHPLRLSPHKCPGSCPGATLLIFSILLHQRFPWTGVRAAGLAALLPSFLVPACALLQQRAHTCCRHLSPLATSWTSRLQKCLPRTKFRLGEVHDEERERGIPGQGRSRAFQVLKKRHVHGLASLSHQRGEHQDSMP